MAERYSPQDLPNGKILYALARRTFSLAASTPTAGRETNGSAQVEVGRVRLR